MLDDSTPLMYVPPFSWQACVRILCYGFICLGLGFNPTLVDDISPLMIYGYGLWIMHHCMLCIWLSIVMALLFYGGICELGFIPRVWYDNSLVSIVMAH